MKVEFTRIAWRNQVVQIEHAWIAPERSTAPLVVFLHEGLGSLAMWKDFPQHLCDAIQCRGLVYSRPGYGQSTPRATGEVWAPDFLHQQAYEVLPALFKALMIDTVADPIILVGHSDGATIALLFAARCASSVWAAAVLAPHIFVEKCTLASIESAHLAYRETDLRSRLARYHADPDSAFWGWNTAWLNPAFKCWTIEREIAAITCPLLAVQGVDDEYGTLAQIHRIAQQLPQTRLLELAQCGHSPHRDQPEQLIAAISQFLQPLVVHPNQGAPP